MKPKEQASMMKIEQWQINFIHVNEKWMMLTEFHTLWMKIKQWKINFIHMNEKWMMVNELHTLWMKIEQMIDEFYSCEWKMNNN
jgi:hypothetical protein